MSSRSSEQIKPKRMPRMIDAVDLFCGAGGISTGLKEACAELGLRVNLLAVNHWDIAIATHSKNHPDAKHINSRIEAIEPRLAVPSGKLDLLVAAPSCVHHSRARGGAPINDQERISAFRILEWASELYVRHILIENVPELTSWGPLNAKGRPLKAKRGETFLQFIKTLEALNYRVEWRVLNAADYGDPTSRNRLFIQARRDRRAIRWPEPTHAPAAQAQRAGKQSLFAPARPLKPYRTAREIIDWSIESQSIFTRKKPLRPNTLKRIFRGLEKFGGLPFIVPKEGDARVRDLDRPLQTITTQSRGIGLCEAFLVKYFGGHDAHSLDEPIPTICANYEHYALCEPFIIGAGGPQYAGKPRSVEQPFRTVLTDAWAALVESFIVELRNKQFARSLDEPLSVVATSGAHHALCSCFIRVNCQAFLSRFQGNHTGREDGAGRNYPLDNPLPPLDTSNRYGLVQSCIVPVNHGPDMRSHDLDQPMPTITSVDAWGLGQSFLLQAAHGADPYPGRRCHSLDEPLKTITAGGDGWALVSPEMQPFIVKYNSTGSANSVDEPLDTVTTKDRFGLCLPHLGAVLDIRFRMLQPHELAAAMSFPKTYFFAGNREDKVKQIGNAIAVGVGRALCRTILEDRL
jgi:DNA (cytosine-5)-methyltransferase 1